MSKKDSITSSNQAAAARTIPTRDFDAIYNEITSEDGLNLARDCRDQRCVFELIFTETDSEDGTHYWTYEECIRCGRRTLPDYHGIEPL